GSVISEVMALQAPPELLGISTTCPQPCRPTLRTHLRLAIHRLPLSRVTNGAHGTSSRSFIERDSATPTRWDFVRRRCTGLWIHQSALPRGFSTTMRPAMH